MTSNDPTPAPTPAPSPSPSPSPSPIQLEARIAESVLIRPWPKVVFLYPTCVVAVIFFLLAWLDLVRPQVLGNTFMAVILTNLLVFSFDFSRIKSITLLVGGIAVVLLVLWIDSKTDITGFLGRIFGSIDINCSASFYGFLGGGLGILLVIVYINSRFHYYEVNAREILHHHGYLGDIQRWSTEGLEMNKEIYDVAEYMLLRSGRLIFQPATSKKAIVLDNVANVNGIEKQINDLLSVVAVRLNQKPGPG